VHKYFDVNIPRPTEKKHEEWLGTSMNIGDHSCFWKVCCLEYQTLDEVQEPSNPKYHDLNISE
jgi:hypothetical protein